MHFCKNSHNRTLKLLQENKSMQRCHSDTLSNYYGRKSYNSWFALNHFNQAIQFLSLLVPHSRNVCFAILIPCGDNRWEFSEAESWVMWIYPFAPFLSQTHKWKINHIWLHCRVAATSHSTKPKNYIQHPDRTAGGMSHWFSIPLVFMFQVGLISYSWKKSFLLMKTSKHGSKW